MIPNVRQFIRESLLRSGYRIDCVRSIPPSLRDPARLRLLEFEDVVCRRMVECGRPLTFIQVGAFDGVTKDPLYPFITRHGWSGILIEPQASACETLHRLHGDRPEIRIFRAAIAERDGEAILYRVSPEADLPEWCGGLASFCRDSIEKHEKFAPGITRAIVEETVPTRTFSSLFEEASIETSPDLLQMDTEGFDTQLLEWFPFETWRPPIVHFEIKHFGKAELEPCLERLAEFGYRFAPSGGEDLLAVAGD